MRPLPERLPDTDRRTWSGCRSSRMCGLIATTTRSTRAFAGRRVEVRVSQTQVTGDVLDTGELACRHRRSFAGGLTITDTAHQTELERLRARRRQRHEVDVEIRPLSRYDAADPRLMAKTASELSHLFRSLKAPAAARALPVLADRAREEQWSYERFAEILLGTEVSARESHGGEGRIKAARFPARKTLEEFDFTFQRSVKKTVIEHLGQLDFLHARQNVILLGPPGTGKTHLAIALSIRACLAGQRVQFATATEWVARLSEAKRQDNLEAELRRLSFIPLLVIDEVGYIPFDPEAASLMFSLVSNRYERASMIVTSNKPFSKAHTFE